MITSDGAGLEPEAGDLPEVAILKEDLSKKQEECASLSRALETTRTEAEALRGDYSLQQREHASEVTTLNEVLEKSHRETTRLAEEIAALKRDNKQLKSQNLALQHRLNQWGIPVWSGERDEDDPVSGRHSEMMSFPELTALNAGEDPVPVILRGELSSLPFPDLLSFLATSQLDGVVTVVSEGVATKLYLADSVLRLAGWNHPDPDRRLLAVMEQSGILLQNRCTAGEIREKYGEIALQDLPLAKHLLDDAMMPPRAIQAGLREHARMLLEHLFHMSQGAFFFQRGHVLQERELQFELYVTDALLKTAARIDELTQALEEIAGAS